MLKISAVSQSELNRNSSFDKHVKIVRFENLDVGLIGYIAIFNDTFGIAVGGTRIYPYSTEDDALTDALRLSKAMGYKCAVSNIPKDGGKAVIIGDPQTIKTSNFLKSYAEVINVFAGKFYTGEDVGMSEADVQYMLKYSPYFIGKSDQAGDPSEFASLSIFFVMEEAVKKILNKKSLKGLTVGIKGLGKVGFGLLKLLHKEGAHIIGADIDVKIVERVKREYPKVKLVSSEEIISESMDVYAPCALGNEFTKDNVSKIAHAKIICGGANNQLASPEVAIYLMKYGIFFVPDYLANAGGLINVADELEKGGYNKHRVVSRIKNLKSTFDALYKKSIELQITLGVIGEDIIRKKLDSNK